MNAKERTFNVILLVYDLTIFLRKRPAMKKLSAFLLLVLLSTVTVGSRSQTPELTRSIFPVYWTETDKETGQIERHNVCTAFSIDESRHYFMTAAHCTVDADGAAKDMISVGRSDAVVITVDVKHDIAVLKAVDQEAVPFVVSYDEPYFGDAIVNGSYQLGWNAFMLGKGLVNTPYVMPPGADKAYLVFDIPICGGASGSPLLNKYGEVIGVVQASIRSPFESCGSVNLASTYAEVKAFRSYFTE